MPTDIESLAKELQQLRAAALTDLDSEKWEALAAHVLRLCADAELRGLVAVRERLNRTCLMPVTSDVMGVCDALIAAHHAQAEKPKCEHNTQPQAVDYDESNLCRLVRCKCGATRQRGWTSDWKEPGK